MQDVISSFEVDGVVYPFVFNLNVMELIQKEYGSLDAWGDLTDGEAYALREFLSKNPQCDEYDWAELPAEEKVRYKGEPDAHAVIYGFTEMINEGIDMENEKRCAEGLEPLREVTQRQVGRLLTKYGLAKATQKMNQTVIESTQVDIKNV